MDRDGDGDVFYFVFERLLEGGGGFPLPPPLSSPFECPDFTIPKQLLEKFHREVVCL